jgi:hypothetical protein
MAKWAAGIVHAQGGLATGKGDLARRDANATRSLDVDLAGTGERVAVVAGER